MAISTYKVFLMKKNGESYEKVVDIKDFPDLGGAPEMIETTTLSDEMQTYIAGIQQLEALEFNANYDKETYKTLAGMAGENHDFAVWFGGSKSGNTLTPTGDEGKFEFSGTLSVFVAGGGVNEAVGMTITIAPSTPIKVVTE